MFTKSMFAAVVVAASAALSVPAFANGNDQLALSLGVAPGAYTFSQLIELKDAIRDNDQERVNFIKSEGIASRSAACETVLPSSLANSAGICGHGVDSIPTGLCITSPSMCRACSSV